MNTKSHKPGKRSGSLSREVIVDAAIEILDAKGESGLTFRALAARLKTGSGAIYWHVADKSALLEAATDRVVGQVMTEMVTGEEPQNGIRTIALGMFDAIEAHPWIGAHLAREPWQLGMARIVTGIGDRIEALGVPEQAEFDAWSTLINYILGVAGQNAANDRNIVPGTSRPDFFTKVVDRWAEQSGAQSPFMARLATRLKDHDDREQFLAGIDLILAGIGRVR